MLTADQHEQIAAKIYGAINDVTPLPLLNKSYPEIEIEDSYHIQSSVVSLFKGAGSDLKGYKIGLTSHAIQKMVGTTEPNFGPLLSHMFTPEDSELARAKWLTPVLECEIALVLKERLEGPCVNVADVIRAIDFVLPAIEIADFRVARAAGIDVRDLTADLGAAGGVVLGGNPVFLRDIDIRTVSARLLVNNEERAQGGAAQVLGNPLSAVAWLANKLHESGLALEPGQVVLAGAMHGAQPVDTGDAIVARFDSGLGDIKLSFA